MGSFKAFINESANVKEITGNPGYGYHGEAQHEFGEKHAHHIYNVMHAKVMKHAGATHDEAKHFLDSTHGRHMYAHRGYSNLQKQEAHIQRAFKTFKKTYHPDQFAEGTLTEAVKDTGHYIVAHLRPGHQKSYGGHKKLIIHGPYDNKFDAGHDAKEYSHNDHPHFLAVTVHHSKDLKNIPHYHEVDPGAVHEAYGEYDSKKAIYDNKKSYDKIDNFHHWKKLVKHHHGEKAQFHISGMRAHASVMGSTVGEWDAGRKVGTVLSTQREETIHEAEEHNGRVLASKHGLVHPDHAAYMKLGKEHDFYSRENGDKLYGKVIHKTATAVHLIAAHPEKGTFTGKVHKFKIGRAQKVDEALDEGYSTDFHVRVHVKDVHSHAGNHIGTIERITRTDTGASHLAASYHPYKGAKGSKHAIAASTNIQSTKEGEKAIRDWHKNHVRDAKRELKDSAAAHADHAKHVASIDEVYDNKKSMDKITSFHHWKGLVKHHHGEHAQVVVGHMKATAVRGGTTVGEWDAAKKVGTVLSTNSSPYMREETIVESLPDSASASDFIHDFVHSKNKKFKGDSTKQRIKRALGAYYAKNEEVIDELSKKTLGSYVKKAADKTAQLAASGARSAPLPYGPNPHAIATRKKAIKHLKGIDKATDKLTKEEVVNEGNVPKVHGFKEFKTAAEDWAHTNSTHGNPSYVKRKTPSSTGMLYQTLSVAHGHTQPKIIGVFNHAGHHGSEAGHGFHHGRNQPLGPNEEVVNEAWTTHKTVNNWAPVIKTKILKDKNGHHVFSATEKGGEEEHSVHASSAAAVTAVKKLVKQHKASHGVSEEAINELSPTTHLNYLQKAQASEYKSGKEGDTDTLKKRQKGISNVAKRMFGKAYTDNEIKNGNAS